MHMDREDIKPQGLPHDLFSTVNVLHSVGLFISFIK